MASNTPSMKNALTVVTTLFLLVTHQRPSLPQNSYGGGMAGSMEFLLMLWHHLLATAGWNLVNIIPMMLLPVPVYRPGELYRCRG